VIKKTLIVSSLTFVNSGAFLILFSSTQLTGYLLLSSLYGTLCWIFLWLLPSSFPASSKYCHIIRVINCFVSLLAAFSFLLLGKSLLAVFFGLLLVSELTFFPTSIIYFKRSPSVYHTLEIAKGSLNLFSLVVVCFLRLDPSFYVLGLFVSSVLVGIASFYVFPFSLRIGLVSLISDTPSINYTALAAFLKPSTLLLLSSRLFEAIAFWLCGYLSLVGFAVCLKIAFALSAQHAIHSLSRNSSKDVLALVLLYLVFTLPLILVRRFSFGPFGLPDSLSHVHSWSILATIPFLLFSYLVLVRSFKSHK